MVRWVLLCVSGLLLMTAAGMGGAEWSPSALRTGTGAVFAVLAPLFWPGVAATPSRTAWRIMAWSLAAVATVAATLRLIGGPAQPWPQIGTCCAMLLLVLLCVHALCAALQSLWQRGDISASSARGAGGLTVMMALVAMSALPLWGGPLANALSRDHLGLVDAALALSPLVHIAVASGNDLLRNDWFYQQSPLAGVQFSYPGLAELAAVYAAVGAMLALFALALRRTRLCTDMENTRS